MLVGVRRLASQLGLLLLDLVAERVGVVSGSRTGRLNRRAVDEDAEFELEEIAGLWEDDLCPALQLCMLSVLRIMVGVLYMEHGLAKILDFPHQPNHAPYALFTLNPGLQGLLELVGGLLLALGLFTRTVAFILAGNMAVAYFMAHAPRGFFPLLNGGELAIVYCFVFLYLWVAGGGEWSLDRLRTPASALSPSRA